MLTVQYDYQLLAEIGSRAIGLAADRLARMGDDLSEDDFDRGARSVGSLVRTVQQVADLQAKFAKDANADHATVKLTLPSEDDVERFRVKILARLQGDSSGENQSSDCERSDCRELTGGGAL